MMEKPLKRWLWTPIVVFVLGILPAAAMLFWTNTMSERVRTDLAMEGALMDAQIRTSLFHLWFEEALAGHTSVGLSNTWQSLHRAFELVAAILNGGETEHDPITRPLRDPAQRAQAEEITSLLDQLKATALVRQETPGDSGIGSGLDQIFNEVFSEFMDKARTLEFAVEHDRKAEQIRTMHLYWTIVLAWVSVVLVAALGLGSLERRRRLAEEAVHLANERLEIRVAERTRELASARDFLEVELGERRRVEEELRQLAKQLRHLSSRLLTAQESERNRISRELHDELGQALATLKLRIGLIGKGLGEGQKGLREECGELARYADQVIEEVRRLSRDLSPIVLEYMGLSAAIRRMMLDFRQLHGIPVAVDFVEVDHLLGKDAQIVVYRILQEALNNIRKHAQATRVSACMKRDHGHVCFVVEDDGKGFDAAKMLNDNGGGGLGLAIMRERVSMLGGALDLRSEEGKGTRISFTVPVPSEEMSGGAVSDCAGG